MRRLTRSSWVWAPASSGWRNDGQGAGRRRAPEGATAPRQPSVVRGDGDRLRTRVLGFAPPRLRGPGSAPPVSDAPALGHPDLCRTWGGRHGDRGKGPAARATARCLRAPRPWLWRLSAGGGRAGRTARARRPPLLVAPEGRHQVSEPRRAVLQPEGDTGGDHQADRFHRVGSTGWAGGTDR